MAFKTHLDSINFDPKVSVLSSTWNLNLFTKTVSTPKRRPTATLRPDY